MKNQAAKPSESQAKAAPARRKSFHDTLAMLNIAGFFIMCLIVLVAIVFMKLQFNAAEAGIIGAVLGYWNAKANAADSFYYGAQSPPRTKEPDERKPEEVIK